MAWPLSQDYNEAIQDPHTSFRDAELKTGEAVANALGIPMPRSGNFADVYEVRCPSGSRWAVKCFTREVYGLRERYAEIGKYLRLAKLPFMVDFQYLEQGIRVRGGWYPVLKMQWVEGFVLNEFVRDNLDKKPILQALGQIWLRMARRLRESYIAHCDLQHGNVLFVPGSSANALAVKLIDYDGMCVPSLAGTKSGEVGHPAYQHPERLRTGAYDQEVDRFSLLSIATALRCLAVGGRPLWERYDTGDNLLFRQADLQAPAKSPLFQELLAIGDAQARMLVQELYRACQGPLDAVPLLTDLAPEEKPAASAAARSKPQPTSATHQPAARETSVFQDIDAESTGRRSRRRRARSRGGSLLPWIVAGSMAACALVGGVLFWSLQPRSQPEQQQVRADKRGRAKTVKTRNPLHQANDAEAESAPPDNPGVEVTPKPAATAASLLDGPPGEVRRFEGHSGGVIAVALSPDGQRALTAGSDKTVRLWDVASGDTIHTMNGHTQMVWSVAFSPDGKRGVSTAYDGTVRVWDLDTGEEMQIFRGHGQPVRRAVFTSDGKQVLSAGWDRMVRLWNVENAQEIRQYEGNQGQIYWMALSPDGKRVLASGGDRDIHCWDVASGRELEPYKGNTGHVYAIAFSRDGQLVAASGADQVVRIWRTSEPTAPLHNLKGHKGPVNAVAFTPDGRRLMSVSQDQTVRVWDVPAGIELGRFYAPEECKVRSVAVAPDGRFFLSGGMDHMVRLWRLPPPDVLAAKPDDPAGEVQVFNGHTSLVRRVAVSADGRQALSTGHDGTVRLWETATGRELRVFRGHTNPFLKTVVFLPDTRRALSGGDDRVIRLWDLRDGSEIRTFEGHTRSVNSLDVSVDGRRVLSGGPQPDVRVWDVESGQALQRLEERDGRVECVCFSPDGRWVVDGSREGAIHLWDVASGEEVRQFRGHSKDVCSFRFSPDARLALTASRDKTLRLWDVATGAELRRFEGHTDMVEGAAWSPDGRLAVSGSRDKTVRLWDVATGKELHRFEGHTDAIWDVAFCPDGRYVVSGSSDKTLRLWRVPFAPFEVGRPLQIKSGPEPEPAPVAARLPVPDEDAQKKAIEDTRDIYKTDYADLRKADDRVVLAAKLLKRGTNKGEEPDRRFAYLREARDLAARGGDPTLSLRAVDEMAKVFAVEPLPMKADALLLAAKTLRTTDAKKLLKQTLPILDDAESADDYEHAAKLLKIAQTAALKSRDLSLRSVATKRENRLKLLRSEYAKIGDAVKTLADKPDDAKANLTVGKFQCFAKEDWSKGLPMLARSGDATLADLARKEMEEPAGADEQAVELGQAWSAFADKQNNPRIQRAARKRAKHWFYAALPYLRGAEADQIASQLEVKKGRLKFRPGLIAELFPGQAFKRKRIKARLDYTVDYDWGFARPDVEVPADDFCIRWQGVLIPPRTGKYTLTVIHDDGARLKIDGKTVIGHWGKPGRDSKEVALTGQPHVLQLEYREWTATAAIHLRWSLDVGFPEQTIPIDVLFHETKQERLLTP